jgi:2-oxoglutarate ferredoxin oxidoreductase subunit beta
VLFVSGIGQSSKLPHYLRANCFNVIHGRALPAATGAKLANPGLRVIAVGGDGDGYAEGGNHFLHALRRNIGLTYLVLDNQIFALTKGQASPTSDTGFHTGTTPWGLPLPPFNPVAIAIEMNVALVARGYAGEKEHLAGLIAEGIRTPGFALIDILQPCVTFNKVNTYRWYRERCYTLDQSHDALNRDAALAKAREWGDRIPIGILYRGDRPAYETLVPGLAAGPLVQRTLDPRAIVPLLPRFETGTVAAS